MFFIGDIHGQLRTYKWMLNKIPMSGNRYGLDCSLQVGDLGVFNEQDVADFGDDSGKHYFICGNHDNRQLCQSMPNHLGDWGYRKEADLFFVSGGYSIDHKTRTMGVNWWEDEELGYLELMMIIAEYEDIKPRIVVSHECPTVVKDSMLVMAPNATYKSVITSRTERALQAMFDVHQPEYWIFGHYHVRKEVKEGKTNFVGLSHASSSFSDMIFELPDLHL